MKIKEIKTSLSVYFAGSERFHFAAGVTHLYPYGLELEYCDKPEGVIVRTQNAEVWVNLANISYMKFFDDETTDVSRETETTIVRKRGRPAKVTVETAVL